jgi:hypothetical protein
MSWIRRVLGGVVQQVHDHLGQSNPVCVEIDCVLRHDYGQLMSALVNQWPARFHRGANHFRQVHQLLLEIEFFSGDTADIEEIVGQSGQVVDLPLDDISAPVRSTSDE